MTPRLRLSGPTAVTLAALALASAPVPAATPSLRVAATDAAGATEMEFWRSSDRLGTPSAYQAYLDAYPRGVFAPLARAALEKARAATPPSPPAAQAAPAAAAATVERMEPATSLKTFSEEAPNTSSIPYMLGDRFVGPGAITVGWAGAKKQILLPPGTWIALAGIDYKSEQAPFYVSASVPVRADTTSLVFARLSGNRLSALLRFTYNSKRAVVARWSDLDGCDLAGSATTQLSRTRTQTKFGESCASIRASDNWVAILGVAADETRRNLSRIGASMPSGAVVISVSSVGETANGYLGVTRIDFPGGTAADWAPTAVAQTPSRAAWVRQLADWQKRYQAVANEGLTRNIDITELTAGGAAAVPAGAAVVDDFDPTTPR